MKLIFDSPWYLTATAVFLSLGLTLLLYYRNRSNREATKALLVSLFLLRFTALFLVCMLLAGLLLRQVVNETEYPRVILAIDNSASMLAGSDSNYISTELSQKIDVFKTAIADEREVHTIWFGSEVSAGDPGGEPFTEKETDIDEMLRAVSNNYGNQSVGALVVFSDGIYNRGSNPAYVVENTGFPVYTMGLGDTTEKTDLLLKKIDHNQIAYLGNSFPVEVQVAARKTRQKNITVEIIRGQEVIATRSLQVGSDNFSGRVTFTLTAASPGIQKYSARVRGDDQEKNATNNRQSFAVEVIDNKEKILLLAAAPHPDIAAIRESVTGSTSYKLDFAYLNGHDLSLAAYNLVIIHGYSRAARAVLDACIGRGIPFWLVNPSDPQEIPGLEISAHGGRYNDAEPVYDKTFGYFTISEELQALAEELPAIKVFFGNYKLSAGSSPLFLQKLGNVETDQPILYFSNSGDVRFGVFLGEGLWKWKFRTFSLRSDKKPFVELISKSIQFLAAKTDKSFFRIKAPKIITENEPLEIEAELYNKSYEPVNDPDVSIVLTNEQNKKYNYVFSKNGNSYRLNIGNIPAGEYRYRASVTHSGDMHVKEGKLVVQEMVAEKINTVANHQVLQQMALKSGGQFYTREQFPVLAAKLAESPMMKPVVYSQNLTRPLIDEKFLFFLALVLFGIEWFFRKRHLLI